MYANAKVVLRPRQKQLKTYYELKLRLQLEHERKMYFSQHYALWCDMAWWHRYSGELHRQQQTINRRYQAQSCAWNSFFALIDLCQYNMQMVTRRTSSGRAPICGAYDTQLNCFCSVDAHSIKCISLSRTIIFTCINSENEMSGKYKTL